MPGRGTFLMATSNKIQQYKSKSAKILHGDCLLALEQIEDESIHLLFADPPYNIGKRYANFVDKWPSDLEYAQWCETWLDLCLQKLHPQGSMYVMTSTQSMPYLDLYLRERITILSRIVWSYDSSGVQAKNKYGSMYEPILYCVKDPKHYTFNSDSILVEAKTGAKRKLIDYRKPTPTPYNTQKVPGNVWEFPRVRYRMEEYENHPTQKPEKLLERIILASSSPGELVLDPFAGTFTTCAVAQRLKRKSIGIESELEYVKIGIRRLKIQSKFSADSLKAPQKNFKRRSPSAKK